MAKSTIATLEARVVELEETVVKLMAQMQTQALAPQRGARNYGPDSMNSMTDEMAWRIRYGDLVATPVKTIAVEHGLSHGQIYSVRGNYTFTKITAGSYRFDEETSKIVKA